MTPDPQPHPDLHNPTAAAGPIAPDPAAAPSVLLLRGMAALLVLQALGELISRSLHGPVPGPVVGMGLLLLALTWAPLRAPIELAAGGLLAHLSLLFVPVGVGVMTHARVLSEHGWAIAAALVLSTWVGMLTTAWLMKTLSRSAP